MSRLKSGKQKKPSECVSTPKTRTGALQPDHRNRFRWGYQDVGKVPLGMTSTNFRTSLSVRDVKGVTGGKCPNMCGVCPPCVFAPQPPGSTHCLWTLSDSFKRTFVLELILRCRDVQVLQEVLAALGLVTWNLFTYARSETPRSPRDSLSSERGLDGIPLGADVVGIWDWFTDSPDLIKTGYLLRIFSRCDLELLRVVVNLSSVLLARLKRGLPLTSDGRDPFVEDPEQPSLCVTPGSSKSKSGVSRYRDFIGCLPINLSKRIMGLLDEQSLKVCQKVCRYWQDLAQDILEEVKFRRNFQEQIKAILKKYRGIDIVSHTYANFVEVPVPTGDDGEPDKHPDSLEFELFESPGADVETTPVKMEERNVYCSPYYTKVVFDVEDPHRVLDYRGGPLMAVGSKDRAVHLLSLGSETKVLRVMKGHVGVIREVLLCEERDLAITASSDASIRCWNLKTDRCVMALYGHTGTVNCLDLHGDRLVSGSKDRLVKVWNIQTGRDFKEYHFKHPSAVKCVKTNETRVFSSCDHGLIKVWDMEKASLIRIITAHNTSVRCLFLDQWHFLSADCDGQVMAWSVKSDAKHCLKIFRHAKEVHSLTLAYLRVVTGCVDGKVRVFNFLTGDCLRVIEVETESHQILSVHFNDSSIIANTALCVKHLQFSKVFWDYSAADNNVSEESPSSAELPSSSTNVERMSSRNSERTKATHFLSPSSKYRPQELKPARKAKKGPNTRERLLRTSPAHKTQRLDAECTPGAAPQDTLRVGPGKTKTCGPDCQRIATPQRIQSRQSKVPTRVAGPPSSTAGQQGRPSQGHPDGSVRGGSSLQDQDQIMKRGTSGPGPSDKEQIMKITPGSSCA